MASAQTFGRTSNWIALVGSGDGLLWEFKRRAGSKTVCCDADSVDDVEHIIFDCIAMNVERQKHQSQLKRGQVALIDFLFRTQQN